ncbi:MAG: hypothetical protein IJ561_05835 [Ruminococcus sp.]|nr:hypothetical protein [Ruminococcus sp.]
MFDLEFVDILNESASEREAVRIREMERQQRSEMAAAEGELVCQQGRMFRELRHKAKLWDNAYKLLSCGAGVLWIGALMLIGGLCG